MQTLSIMAQDPSEWIRVIMEAWTPTGASPWNEEDIGKFFSAKLR